MLDSALAAFTPFNLALAFFGVVAGTVIGALPGLSATMAVAVLVPFTFTMEPASGLVALGAVYTGAIYGGAYSAILVNTPGTPSAIATAMDGYPMARNGDGDLAITLSCLGSVFGGLVGALALLTLAPPLSRFALAFGPVEYFWLAIFGLSLIAALSHGNTLKGLVGGGLGLLLSCVGSATVGGDLRYTFGRTELLGGIPVIPALIGLYCVPVLIDLVIRSEAHLERRTEQVRGFRFKEALALMWRSKVNVVRSAVLGTGIGILPAAGGSVAGLVAYSEARRTSHEPERFGRGHHDGVIASESANSATVGGGFIPTLVLGIPGTPPDAIILGALLVQGIKTGPQLFTQQADIVNTFVIGLMIATVLMLPTGLVIGRYAFRLIISIPKTMLVPAIALLTVIGAFALESNVVHVLIMVVLGLGGWTLARAGFEASPIVLGLILGPIAESGFVQGWLIGGAQQNVPGMFFGRPLSLAILAMIALTLLSPALAQWRRRRLARKDAGGDAGGENPDTQDNAGMALSERASEPGVSRRAALLGAGFAVVVGIAALSRTPAMSDLGAVFPTTAGLVVVLGGLALVVIEWRKSGDRKPVRLAPADRWRLGGTTVVLVLWALSFKSAGFVITAMAGMATLAVITWREPVSTGSLVAHLTAAVALVAGFYSLMRFVLNLAVP